MDGLTPPMNKKFFWHDFRDTRRLSEEDRRLDEKALSMGLIAPSDPIPLVKPSKVSRPASGKKRCVKGDSCGATCIDKLDDCRREFPPEVQSSVSSVSVMLRSRVERGEVSESEAEEVISSMKALSPGQRVAFEKFRKMQEEGKVTDVELEQVANLIISTTLVKGQDRKAPRMPSFEEVEAILKHGKLEALEKAYRNSFDSDGKFDPSRPGGMGEMTQGLLLHKISPEVAELAYEMLSTKAKSALNKMGSPPAGRTFGGYDEAGNPVFVAGPNRNRGIFLVRRFMEQGGRDPYTKRRIDIFNAEPEHMVASSHVSARSGSADQPLNLLWAAPTVNNSKGGTIAQDDFGLWRKQLLEIQGAGRDAYRKKYDEAVARSLKTKGREAAAPTDLGAALAKTTPQERVASIAALSQAYGTKSKYLVRAAGFSSEAWNKQVPGTGRPKRISMDAPYLKVSVGGKEFKPSTVILLAAAALDPSERVAFIRAVDTLRMKREMSRQEADSYSGRDDPRYKKRMEDLAQEFENGLQSLVSRAAPGLASYL